MTYLYIRGPPLFETLSFSLQQHLHVVVGLPSPSATTTFDYQHLILPSDGPSYLPPPYLPLFLTSFCAFVFSSPKPQFRPQLQLQLQPKPQFEYRLQLLPTHARSKTSCFLTMLTAIQASGTSNLPCNGLLPLTFDKTPCTSILPCNGLLPR